MGATVNTSVTEFSPVDVCAQENTITITIGTGDESATWSESLVNCCITNPNCYYYDVTINGTDLAASTGNTIYPDYTVFVNYTDCDGNPADAYFATAGFYPNFICIDETQLITVSYYQDNFNYLTSPSSSFVTQQGNCP